MHTHAFIVLFNLSPESQLLALTLLHCDMHEQTYLRVGSIIQEDSPAAQILTAATAPAVVGEFPKAMGVFSKGTELSAVEIHGGNLNYAFQVKNSASQSVFVKQAPDFIKCLGPKVML